jgi:hypothetical protein
VNDYQEGGEDGEERMEREERKKRGAGIGRRKERRSEVIHDYREARWSWTSESGFSTRKSCLDK